MTAPLLPDDGPRGARVLRRVRSITIEMLALLVVTALLPVLLPGAALVDLVLWLRSRKPWMAVRLVAVAWLYLAAELRGLTTIAVLWIASGGRDTPRRRRGIYRLRQNWLGMIIGGIRRLFRMTFEIEGLEQAGPGPVVILIRHASIIDNTLPDTVIGRAHDLGLRFVIKRELSSVPTIDIAGRWVPTVFVRRGSGDTEAELERLALLTEDLGPAEGILIYPEGTRCTAEKLARAKEIVAERQPELASRAQRLRHLLPPRLGGTLALLEGTRGSDVVVFGHVGLDGFEYVSDIWSGGLIGTTVRMRIWRHSADSIPAQRAALAEWVYDRWLELDEWIEHRRTDTPRSAKATSAATQNRAQPL